ncbi:MAG: cation diffusion facilitator family transporter [Lentisphaerota bacterium]
MNNTEGFNDSERQKALRMSFIAGLFDVIITVAAFAFSNSSVLLADFLKTTIEFIAVLLSLLAMRKVCKGADSNFEYGLGKLENLSSMFVGTTMALSFMIITGMAFKNIIHPEHISGYGLWISIFSQTIYFFINGMLCLKNRRAAKLGASPIMAAQARLFLTRFIGNLFILLSLVLSMTLKDFKWSVYIDPTASLMIAFAIFLSTIGIFKNSFMDLLDKTLEENHQIIILGELALCFNEYEQIHGIRSRRSGNKVYIEIFIEFEPEKKVSEITQTIAKLSSSISQKITGSSVTIGVTPPVTLNA